MYVPLKNGTGEKANESTFCVCFSKFCKKKKGMFFFRSGKIIAESFWVPIEETEA